MKKKTFLIVLSLCIVMILSLAGCSMLGDLAGDNNKKEYKIIFANTSIPSSPIVDGRITMPEDPTSEGYDFGGWFVDSACTIPFDQEYLSKNPITGDIRVYPKWIKKGTNIVIVTLNVNGGDELLDNTIEITKGMNVAQELPIPTLGGYAFVGWYDALIGGEQITGPSGEIINYNGEDITLYARWEITTYEVSVVSFDNTIGTVSGGKTEVEYLEEVTVTATTLDENYTFLGWYDGTKLVSESLTYSFIVENDISLVAKWLGENRTINFYRNYMEGDLHYEPIDYCYGAKVSYTPSRRAGYTFIGWYDNPECTGTPVCVNGVFEKMLFEDNASLYACWSEGHDQLTYEQIGNTETVRVTGVKDGAGAIIHIPTTWSDYKVTTIGENAFKNSNHNAIVISSSIVAIEQNAFSEATANIYFDKDADLTLLNTTNFTSAQRIYTHVTLGAENELIDGEYVEANGILADDYINTPEEGRAFYSYCWLYTHEEEFTLTIDEAVYDGDDAGFKDAMIGTNGVFKNVNLELGLKSETDTSFSYGTNPEERTITFIFKKKTGNSIASGYLSDDKLQTQSKGLINVNKALNNHDFEIDSMPEFVVYNSEQLVYAVEHGYRPIFGNTNTSAENCYDKAREILSYIIQPEMTNDIQKIIAIHDYIALNVTYDSELLEESTANGVDSSSVSHYRGFYLEGVFEDGKAVCDGITKAFMLMCRIEGIEAIRVSGLGRSWNATLGCYVDVGHAWNKVHVGEKWYTVDVTNDDSILGITGTNYSFEVLNHQFFMVSDDLIAGSHIEDTFVYKDKHVSNGNYDYYANVTYDGTRDLVITSQNELEILVNTLKQLSNKTDKLYTAEIRVHEDFVDAINWSIAGIGHQELAGPNLYMIFFTANMDK